MLLNKKPLVAVYMITYNHEQYIKQAINSILNQYTKFSYKLFIGDDASSDNTKSICKMFEDEYPNKIKLFPRKKNIGASANAIFTFNECFKSGAKYIALCEGDDYWTDPLKLQKQVDFLEANSDYGICFHNVKQVNTLNNTVKSVIPNVIISTNFTIQDYIVSNKTATCAMLFKAKHFNPIPNWFAKVPFGDLAIILSVLKASNEKGYVLHDVMGVYRIHEEGIHGSFHKDNSSLIKAYKQHITFFKIIKKQLLFEKKYHKAILTKLEKTNLTIAALSKKERNIFSFYRYKSTALFYRYFKKLFK